MSIELHGDGVNEALAEHSLVVTERLEAGWTGENLPDHERASLMAELSIGFSPSWDRVAGPAPIKVTDPKKNGTAFGLFSTVDDVPICFFGGVAFHPGREAKPVPSSLDFPPNNYLPTSSERDLIVLDTGWVKGEPPIDADIENFPHDPDVPGPDLVLGHGPAIVDIASAIMGPSYTDRVSLRQPDYFGGALEAATLVPAIRKDGSWTGKYVRAVDQKSVEIALDEIFEDPANNGAVLSLSLGTVVDRETAENNPPFARYLPEAERAGITIVAAAGNHSSREPMWPAAHGPVVAVGSGDQDNSSNLFEEHGFSGHGEWVDCYTDGRDVPVDIDGPPSGSGSARPATWTGTSFAAPKVAAMIAEGIDVSARSKGWHQDLGLHRA